MLPQLFACHVESCQKQDALGYNRFRSPNFLSIAPDSHTNHIICTTSISAITECVSYKETNELQGKINNRDFLLPWPKDYTLQYLLHLTIQAYTCVSNCHIALCTEYGLDAFLPLRHVLCLFSTTHCSLLRLIVRSGLDVPNFATRRLHACHHARAPSGGK